MALIIATSLTFAGNEPVKKQSMGKQFKISTQLSSDKAMNEGGFFLNIGLVVPSKQCYVPLIATNNSSDKFGVGPVLEVGNMFRIKDFNDHALGLRATWLSASYSSFSNSNVDMSYLQGSVLRIGPYFTYSISDEMAIDCYYQIGATYVLDSKTDTAASGRSNAGYLGATHNMGVSFRYKVFSVGFDMSLGSVKYFDKEEYKGLSDDMINDFYKIRTTQFRFIVGFKF
jgi:hypothetical protein